MEKNPEQIFLLGSAIVRMAKENSGWGYDRSGGALSNLGHSVSDGTVGNILRRHGIAPAPKRCDARRQHGRTKKPQRSTPGR